MKKTYFILLLTLILLNACSDKYEMRTIEGFTQGTYYRVKYFDSLGRDFTAEIDSLLTDFDYTASVYNASSIISKINQGDTQVVLNHDFVTMFTIARQISESTQGEFDITVSPLVKAWGFGPQGGQPVLNDGVVIDSLLECVGWQKVKLEQGKIIKAKDCIQLDMNAIAQGYSVDKLSEYLLCKGIHNYLVDIGGEVRCGGYKVRKPWRVGIEDPTDENPEVIASIPLYNKAIVTSGNYRKYKPLNGERYSHIINPHTGYPLKQSLLSVAVLHRKAVYADAYATAFMVMGVEASKKFVQQHTELEVYMIYNDNGNIKVYASPGMQQLINEQ